MDIVAALATQLKVDPNAAAGLAGGLLLLIEDIVREKASFAAASVIRDKVPEMRDWQMSSPTLSPGMLSVHNLPPSHPLAGEDAELHAVLSRFGVDAGSAGLAASLMHQFLASRLDAPALATVTAAMPTLLSKV